MSVKIAIAEISGWLDLALLPIKSVLGQPARSADPVASRKVAIITQTPDGVSLEDSVCQGELDACQTAAVELMHGKRKLVLEGFHLEEVAALCFDHNYRWRFEDSQGKRFRFFVEPGVPSLPPDDRS